MVFINHGKGNDLPSLSKYVFFFAIPIYFSSPTCSVPIPETTATGFVPCNHLHRQNITHSFPPFYHHNQHHHLPHIQTPNRQWRPTGVADLLPARSTVINFNTACKVTAFFSYMQICTTPRLFEPIYIYTKTNIQTHHPMRHLTHTDLLPNAFVPTPHTPAHQRRTGPLLSQIDCKDNTISNFLLVTYAQ